MRKPVTLLLLATSVASAGPSKTPVPAKAPAPVKDDVKPIDLGPVADKLAAYKDEVGNIYVVPQTAKFDDTSEPQKWFFYGDGKTMYQQRVNRFTTGKGGIDASLLAPRAKDMVSGGYMVINNDEKYIACRPARVQGGRRELTALTADETAAVLKGKFLPPMPMRLPHFLGRDDDANYYYVDQLPSEAGGKGFRVYVGQTGAMKQLALTNMATDSAGEIYATKTGKLKLSAGKDLTAVWVKGGKRVELTIVPPADNRYLVFRELGIYGSLGTVCDDQ